MSDMTSSPEKIKRALDFVVSPMNQACGCMGPQGDQPLCPCAMSTVIRWKGIWINLVPIRGEEPDEDYLTSLVP